MRELDQCLRNILVRREYHPAGPELVLEAAAGNGDPYQSLAADMRARRVSADDVMRRYCTLVYREEGSFERAAQRLRLDRRTVRAKMDG